MEGVTLSFMERQAAALERKNAREPIEYKFQPLIEKSPQSKKLQENVKLSFFERQAAAMEKKKTRELEALATPPATAPPFPQKKIVPKITRRSKGCEQAVEPKSGPPKEPADEEETLRGEDAAVTLSETESGDQATSKKTKKKGRSSTSAGPSDSLSEARDIRRRGLEAAAKRKVFTVYGGYQSIRDGLLSRGWVYKPPPIEGNFGINDNICGLKIKKAPVQSEEGRCARGDKASSSEANEESLMARALAEVPSALIWTCKRTDIDMRTLLPEQLINHFVKSSALTTKVNDGRYSLDFGDTCSSPPPCHFEPCSSTQVGLSKSIRKLLWFENADHREFFPECFFISNADEMAAFIENFRRLAAYNVLLHRSEWNVPDSILTFAFQALEDYQKAFDDDRLSGSFVSKEPSAIEWEAFLQVTSVHSWYNGKR